MMGNISVIDCFLRYFEPALNSSLKEYVERGRFRIEKGLADDAALSFSGISYYLTEIIAVEGTTVVISVKYCFSCEGSGEDRYGALSVCRWNIPLKEKGLTIGEFMVNAEEPQPEWLYEGNLFPGIWKNDYPRMAELFIRKVFGDAPPLLKGYPLALEMVGKLGLNLAPCRLPEGCRSRIVMADGISGAGTIFYDSGKIPPDREDLLAPVILRCCFHRVFHRAAFELYRLKTPEVSAFTCRDDGMIEEMGERFIELDADRVVSGLLFSTADLQRDALGRIEGYRESRMTRPEILGKVLEEVSKAHRISLNETRLRLIGTGMSEFRGIKSCVDGKYLDNYIFTPGSLKDNETFIFPGKGMERLFAEDESVRSLILGGDYIYVDSHLVLNSSRYVGWRNPVTPFLTSYARLHADECFVKIRLTGQMQPEDIGCRYFCSNVPGEGAWSYNGNRISEYELVFPSLQNPRLSDEWRDYLRRWIDCRRDTPGATLGEILRMKNMTADIFSDEERVSPSFIRRICSGSRWPGFNTTIIIAGRLNMPYEIIPWFTAMFLRHFYSNKPDLKHYLDAMKNASLSEDASEAVRDVLLMRTAGRSGCQV